MKVEKVFCIEQKYPEDFAIEIWLTSDYIIALLSDGLYVKVQKELLECRLIMTEAK